MIYSVFDFISSLRNLRDGEKYDEFIRSTELAVRSSSSILKQHELGNKNASTSKFYRQIYFELVDNIITQLKVRYLNCETVKFLKLGDVNKFSDYQKFFSTGAVNSLKEAYSQHFDKEKLKNRT